MCATCGCGDNQVHIEGDPVHGHPAPGALPFAGISVTQRLCIKRARPLHGNLLAGAHHHDHHQADIPSANDATVNPRRLLTLEQDVLTKNNRIAAQNRAQFQAKAQYVLNLVSSPGSGKTTLLTKTLHRLNGRLPCAVIEGDQQTANDAERIRATGTPAIQVNTGKGCHLDASMIRSALPRLALPEHGLLFIENVGNLVCPAGFDLGEQHKVVVLSVTEGEDKPLKYPHMFAAASLMLLNKVDLLPWLTFDVDKCLAYARQVNPHIEIILTSAVSGDGLDNWINWLETKLCV